MCRFGLDVRFGGETHVAEAVRAFKPCNMVGLVHLMGAADVLGDVEAGTN